jgi:carboxylesterase
VPVLPGAEPFVSDPGDGSREIGVVLSHGLTGTPQSMRAWGEFLASDGIGVRGPRLPGHGTRWQDLNRTRWTDWYGEVERAVDDLRREYRSVFVFGQSMGGTLTLRLAQERGDDLAGIALVNPSVTTLRKDATIAPYIQWIVPFVPGVANDIKKPGATELAYDRLPTRAAVSLTTLWRLVRADLERVRLPVLLFHSPTDHVVEPVNSTLVLQGISSHDVTDVVLDDSHHVATLDNDAPRIFSDSLAFVRRVHDDRIGGSHATDTAVATPGTPA